MKNSDLPNTPPHLRLRGGYLLAWHDNKVHQKKCGADLTKHRHSSETWATMTSYTQENDRSMTTFLDQYGLIFMEFFHMLEKKARSRKDVVS